jgi:2,4-dienoyl-CoA reductase-like NADH-dependent reductase (Old Yellow Enzyme family)/thioredoxin reductase
MMVSAENSPHLFEQASIGSVTLRNRLVMLPMGTAYASQHGEVTQKTIDYFVERSKGGVGLITLGNVSPYLPNIINQLVLDSDWVLMGHYELAEKIHAYGAKVCVQISHAGRQKTLSTMLPGEELISSSAIASDFAGIKLEVPRAMDKSDIDKFIEKYAKAAMRAKKVGYDMVEIHGAHGYLINQFISPFMNKRDDEYGGSLENRMRFPLQIISAVRGLVGGDFPIGFRISADEFVPGGITLKDSVFIAEMLESAGIDYISVSAGLYESIDKMMCTMRAQEGWRQPLWKAINGAVSIPVIAGGSLRDPVMCQKIISNNEADFIGLARPLYADPRWPVKAKRGEFEDIRKCISCNECAHDSTRRRSGERHCAINAAAGREKGFADIVPAKRKKKVMVVGGGPAGMEAARVSASRGHEVSLYEKNDALGGQLILASRPKAKQRILWLRDYLERQLEKLGVHLAVNMEVNRSMIENISPDVIVWATGADPIGIDIPGKEKQNVLNGWDLLQDNIKISNEKVAVIGGGLIGVETADYLLETGNTITIIEQLESLAQGMETKHKNQLLNIFKQNNVKLFTGRKAVEILDNQVNILNAETGEMESIEVDRVVIAVGTKPSDTVSMELDGIVQEQYTIGDCSGVGFIMDAVYEGSLVGRQI